MKFPNTLTTADRPFTLVKEDSDEARHARAYGRFLCSYCFRGHAEEIDESIINGERVVHVDCGEAVNVYAVGL